MTAALHIQLCRTAAVRNAAAARDAAAATTIRCRRIGAAHWKLICGIVHNRRPTAILLGFHIQWLLVHGSTQFAEAQFVAVSDFWQTLATSNGAGTGNAVGLMRVLLVVLRLGMMMLLMLLLLMVMMIMQKMMLLLLLLVRNASR